MQELRSTEILDKEIQADARKKADKLLKKADADCEAILSSVDTDIAKVKAEKQEFYNKKLMAFKNDQNAFMPLEKERFKVGYISETLSKYINAYLKGLSEDKRIEVAAKNYAFDSDVKVNAYVYGFDVSKVKAFLSKKLGSQLLNCEETKFGKIVLEDDYNLEKPEGILLESEDKSFRVRLTLSEIIGQLLDKNREELSDALFRGQK